MHRTYAEALTKALRAAGRGVVVVTFDVAADASRPSLAPVGSVVFDVPGGNRVVAPSTFDGVLPDVARIVGREERGPVDKIVFSSTHFADLAKVSNGGKAMKAPVVVQTRDERVEGGNRQNRATVTGRPSFVAEIMAVVD